MVNGAKLPVVFSPTAAVSPHLKQVMKRNPSTHLEPRFRLKSSKDSAAVKTNTNTFKSVSSLRTIKNHKAVFGSGRAAAEPPRRQPPPLDASDLMLRK